MRPSSVLMIAALFLLSLSCAEDRTQPAEVGRMAPGFALKDIHGRTARLSDFAGKTVVLDFWATWCGWCRESGLELENLHRKYRDRGVVVLGISMDEGAAAPQRVKEFAGRYGLTYRMLLDDGKTSESYAVRNIPATYVLDKNHVIVKIYRGYSPGLGERVAAEIKRLP